MRVRTGGRDMTALVEMVRALRDVTKAEAIAVVNRDGGIVAADLPRNVSQETFSIMCAAILGAGMTAATELGHAAPHRVLLESRDATVVTTVDRVAPSPSAAVVGRNRTKYHAEPITPPSHTIRNVNRSGRTRSIAISTRARMPPAYRRISGGTAIAVEIHSTNGISRAAMTRNPRRHFHRISVDHLTVGSPPAETPDPL